jgi:hypothetical protein
MNRLLITSALALAIPLTAYASNRTATVWMPGSDVEAAIKAGVEPTLAKNFLRWKVGSPDPIVVGPGANDWTVHVELELEANVLVWISVRAEFDVRLGCKDSGLDFYVYGLEAEATKKGVNWNLSEANKAILEANTNKAIAAQVKPISEGLWKELSFLDHIPGGLKRVCPRFDVTPSGGVKGVLDFKDGCITGQVKTYPCPANSPGGVGAQKKCINGKWQQTSASTCEIPEFDPPPGGETP